MPIQSYSQKQIMDRLRFENPWWAKGSVDSFYSDMGRRLYFDLFYPLVSEKSVKRAVVLMGPRRVGKTVMIYHTIHELLNEGGNPLKIAFVSVETPIYNNIGLDELFRLIREATGQTDPSGWFVFFDEIQYLKNWDVHLKSLVDSYPHTKFIVSGSAAAALKFQSKESGAGRFTDFMLPPLTFYEYIHLKKLDRLIIPSSLPWQGAENEEFFSTNNIQECNRHFVDYLNFGGYPEVIFSEAIQQDPGRYIRSDIVDKVLLRDLPSLYGIRDVQELNTLFTVIAYNTGEEVSPSELSRTAQVEMNLLKSYLTYLEAAYLIKTVHRITEKQTRFKRANYFKIYLTNPSLRSALFAPLAPTDAHMGRLVETAIFAQWILRERFIPFYARWTKGELEVDMVRLDEKTMKPVWAVEVKWSNRYFEKPRELKSLIKFCKEYGLNQAIVTTLTIEGEKEVDGIILRFVPSAVYAYNVGRRTLHRKQKM